MRTVLMCLCLPVVSLAVSACSSSDRSTTTAPTVAAAKAPNALQAGRYELLISGGSLSTGCDGASTTGAAHVSSVDLRPEGSDWVATAVAPGDTLALRLTFEDWPDSRAFTGSGEGRAVRPFPLTPDAPTVEVHGLGARGAAKLAGSVLDPEQGLGAIEVFGTIAGQLVFTGPQGAVTCRSANLILQRVNAL